MQAMDRTGAEESVVGGIVALRPAFKTGSPATLQGPKRQALAAQPQLRPTCPSSGEELRGVLALTDPFPLSLHRVVDLPTLVSLFDSS